MQGRALHARWLQQTVFKSRGRSMHAPAALFILKLYAFVGDGIPDVPIYQTRCFTGRMGIRPLQPF